MNKISINKLMVALLLVWGVVMLGSAQASRIKELVQIEGVNATQLVGYGLVVGLNGTGDSSSTIFTFQSMANMMENLGVTVDAEEISVANVAAVVITAELPAFARVGGNIDVSVASIGDASNLAGGTLLMTPLKGADSEVYAVAQGSLVVGSLAYGGKTAKVQKNHPTSARIPGGALIEREIAVNFNRSPLLTYRLKDADFTTMSRMTREVNKYFNGTYAKAIDAGEMQVRVPDDYRGNVVGFVAELELINVVPDTLARIVVNEKTGTIVMGEAVRISTVAVSHGNLTLLINENIDTSQPMPFTDGETLTIPQTEITVVEDASELMVIEQGVSIGDVAAALNAIGATPRDLIAIFQAIKAAGAMYADLVIL